MPTFLKIFFAIIFTTFFISACSTTEEVTSTQETLEPETSKYPAWYNASGASADSLNYHGFGTAVSSDSLIAIANAKLEAKRQIEKFISDLTEKAREKLEDEGVSMVTEKEFLLTFRNAHDGIEEKADVVNESARMVDEYYRGFSHVTFSKEQLHLLLESDFKGKSRFWQTIVDAEVFEVLFK